MAALAPLLLTLGLPRPSLALGPKDPPPSPENIRSWQWAWNERKLTQNNPKYWRHDPSKEPPYRPPKDWVYNTSSGPIEGKINVHLVPHTHDDTGWQVTVDQYFFTNVYYILDNVVRRLHEDPNRRFMYVETGFFKRWWDQQPESIKNMTRRVVQGGQLEFINGGWCMHDEASPYYVEMVDQTTRGHQFLVDAFGPAANPKGTWQIDPFGHSNTQAWLLSAEAGMGSLFWGRMDYQDGHKRYENSGLEWIWRGSESLGKSAEIFAGELYGRQGSFGYGAPMSFDGTGTQVQDDPSRHDYNIDQQVEEFIGYALEQAKHTKTNHIMWACGNDFNYQNAIHWYRNLDKLIHYVNLNGTVNAFYSTPSYYVEQKNKANIEWEVREEDIFPLADAAHNYWTGYFTSRPALKRQVRFASNLLNAARQMEVVGKLTKDEVGTPTIRPSPPVGTGWTDSLEGTIGVATHHDGMSGTERQDVSDDYELRIAESQTEVEVGMAKSLNLLINNNASTIEFSHCGCAQMEVCLNMSMCAFTADASDGFSVVAWSPIGRPSSQLARVPVTGTNWKVADPNGNMVNASVVPIDDITKNLPLLYINYFQKTKQEIAQMKREYANNATHVLYFSMDLPSMGFTTYTVSPCTQSAVDVAEVSHPVHSTTVTNGIYSLEITDGYTTSLTNLRSNITTAWKIEWGWYNSSTGGCTKEIPGPPASEAQCSSQASGAYMFRPNSSRLFFPGPKVTPTVTVTKTGVVTELRQVFSEWASHVIRLFDNQPFVEVEWTAGPIPTDTPWIQGETDTGKEVVVRYSTDLESKGTFFTDSNGREMVKRQYNGRGPSYPQPLNVSEPIAGNYYPVNAMIALQDKALNVEMAIITDVAQGGSSIHNGSLELMVHRRVLVDDNRGVQEPLNETMCGCNDINAPPGSMGAHGHLGDGGCICAGLTVRGRHWVILDTIQAAHASRRQLDELLNFPATLAFSAPMETRGDAALPTESENVRRSRDDVRSRRRGVVRSRSRDFLGEAFPANVKLMTLTDNYKDIANGKTLLRLAHLYSVGEHPTLSEPAVVDLKKVFSAPGLTITSAEETSLTGNQPLKQMDDSKLVWKTYDPWNYTGPSPYDERKYMDEASLTVSLRPMELRTFWVTFE